MLVDNKSVIALSKNLVYHSRSKHIVTRYPFIRSYMEEKKVDLEYIPTDEQLVDMFTKLLGRLKFVEMRSRIGLQNVCGELQDQGGH